MASELLWMGKKTAMHVASNEISELSPFAERALKKMELPLQITFHGLPHSDAIADAVQKRVAKLHTFYSRIISCRVAIESPHQHKHTGRPYHVRINIGVPGDELVVSRDVGSEVHEDAYATIGSAFDSAERLLSDFSRLQRGAVKHHEQSAPRR